MIRGYARVSTRDQTLALQQDALEKYGCDKIYTDIISGLSVKRPGLDELQASLEAGDTFVVWKLDRVGRSTLHLCSMIDHFLKIGVNFVSLQDNLDLTTATGKFHAQITSAFAELERSLIVERTRAGIDAARARGSRFGRPHATTDDQDQMIFDLREIGASVEDIARTMRTSVRTIYRRLSSAE